MDNIFKNSSKIEIIIHTVCYVGKENNLNNNGNMRTVTVLTEQNKTNFHCYFCNGFCQELRVV